MHSIINVSGARIILNRGFVLPSTIEVSEHPVPRVDTDGNWIVPMPEQYKNVTGVTVVVFLTEVARKAILEGWKNITMYDPHNKAEDPRRPPSGFERK